MIKLIASDMDGTLLTSQSQLPNNFKEALDLCLQNDIRLVLASGRSADNMKRKLEPYLDSVFLISDNGALVWADNRYIYEDTLNKEDIIKVEEIGKKFINSSIVGIGEKAAYAIINDPIHRDYLYEYYDDFFEVESLGDVEEPFVKITFISLEDTVYNYENFCAPLLDHLSVLISGKIWIDVMNKHIDKQAGLNFLCQYTNILPNQVLAFGDYFNDAGMLTFAGHGIAVSNAHPEIKALADEIIGSNDEEAVSSYIIDLLKG